LCERFCAFGDSFGIVFGEADPPKVECVVLNALVKHRHFSCRDKSARYNEIA